MSAGGRVDESEIDLADSDDGRDHSYINVGPNGGVLVEDAIYENTGAASQGRQSFDMIDQLPDKPKDDAPYVKLHLNDSARDEFKETLFFIGSTPANPKRIDFVLVYADEKGKDDEVNKPKRQHFLANLDEEGLEHEIEDKTKSVDGKSVYVKIHATWDALTTGAELMDMKKRIHMPKELGESSGTCHCADPLTVGEPIIAEEDDFFTAPFVRSRLDMFEVDPHSTDSTNTFFSNAERSLIVKEILDRTSFTAPDSDETRFGINKLIRDGVFTAAYPLHEGPYKVSDNDRDKFVGIDKDRVRLWESWARPGRWYCYQPLDLIRSYFGEKIAIYFTWLGFYTAMLIPPAIIGLGVFIYGIVTLWTNPPSNEICDADGPGSFIMCPQCDNLCSYWRLKESCLYSQITYVFDNMATVAFAAFMSVWATCFLEFWKRTQKKVQYDWDVANFELEERMRPEFEFKVNKKKENPITKVKEPYMPWYSKVPRVFTAWVVVLFMICLVVGAIFGVIVYRIVVVGVLYALDVDVIRSYAKIITSLTAAVCNLIIIIILNLIYRVLAEKLTELEQHRTESEFEDSFTFKMFLFQFVNFYGSTFYIAFFKGSFIDHPGSKKLYLFGQYKQDSCDPSGCMVDLFIQIAIVMVGKQSLNNAKEIMLPFIKTWCRRKGSKKGETEDNLYMRWEQDKDLEVLPRLGLFEEYLEMVIQFGFVTIFVAAFPLAPLFALLNNIVEIRLDAYKFLAIWQRPAALRAMDIGVWYDILTGLSFLAVLSNAFIIAWTSDFVPKMVYLWRVDTLVGYVSSSLSSFTVADLVVLPSDVNITDISNSTFCRYKGWREPPTAMDPLIRYDLTREHWEIFAARLAFVIVFEHACFFITWGLAYLIPDVSADVKRLMIYEKQLTKKMNFDHTFEAVKQRRTEIRSALIQNSLQF